MTVAEDPQLHALAADAILANASADDGSEFLRLVFPGRADEVLSYRELVDEASRWSAHYLAWGLAPGDRVIVVLRHSLDLYCAYLGALLGGMVPVMFAFPSPKLSETEYFRTIGALLAGARAKLLVAYPELARALLARERESLGAARVVTPEDLGGEAGGTMRSSATPAATAFLQYSSGTTGLKKGVAVSHRALLWQIDAYAGAIRATPQDRIVSWLPLYHDMGLIACFFLPLLRRVPLVAMSPFDWVKRPAMWIEAVARHGGTLSWLPNFAYNFLAANVRVEEVTDADLGSLRGIVNCSEPILASSHDALLARFGGHGLDGAALATSYALAENTFAATSGGFGIEPAIDVIDRGTFDERGQALPARPGPGARTLVSSGRPLPETEVLVVDADGRPLPARSVGEILLRSPSLMSCYDGNAEATARALRDGWYWSGDLGYLAGGELYVTGRKQDLVIVGGKNVYPQDVEAVVNNVPGISPGRVVAFGVPREELGTEALVVLAETTEPDAGRSAAIRHSVHEAVAAHTDLVPADVRLLGPRTLVKSTSGKISRSENRRRYMAEWSSAAATPADDDPVREAVLALVAQDADPAAIDDDTPLLASGLLDSFATAELLVALERATGTRIPDDALAAASFETIADIRRLIDDAGIRTAGTRPDRLEEAPAVPLVYDDATAWPGPPRRPTLRTLLLRLRLRLGGVRCGPGLQVLGPVRIELLGAARNLAVGAGVTLMPGVHLKLRENGRIVLHDRVKLDTAVRLVAANDATIEVGENAALGAGTIVNAGADVTIGRGTITAAYCVVNASDHGLAAGVPIREQAYEHAPIRVGEDVWLGAGVFVAKGSTIGDGSVVSAGAVVSGAIPANAVAQGRPARVVSVRR